MCQLFDGAGAAERHRRLELLREIVPGLRRLAIIANVDSTNAVLEMVEVQKAARILNLDIVP